MTLMSSTQLLTQFLLLLASIPTTFAYLICPGLGLSRNHLEIVIFEHTEMGTGGLVLNCPTPLTLDYLPSPRFAPFKELPLMLGCGMTAKEEHSLPLGDVSPWFWLHDLPNVEGSFALVGAAGPLYMGGNLEQASEVLQSQHMDPKHHFKFFRRYVQWEAGQLDDELQKGKWKAGAQDPRRALETVMPRINLEL